MSDTFSFPLNETIAFHPEQEVEEMLGIALEPVISIQEMDDVVSLRGVMELKGEYKKGENDQVDRSISADSPYAERIENLSDDICEFFHKFIVDVQIPMERVANVEDVEIEIEHFDYSLRSSQEMKIEANLQIHGINDEEVTSSLAEDTLEAFSDTRESANNDGEVFQFTVNEDRQLEENEQPYDEQENELEPNTDEKLEYERNEEKQRAIEEVEAEDREEAEDTPSREASEANSMNEEDNNVGDITSREGEKEEEEEPVLEEDEKDSDTLHVQGRRDQIPDDSSYLLHIFADEEESSYSRLKLYIVQPEDHIEKIAEKYNTSANSILRTNRLDEDELAEGQLIYIPVSSAE
ncbi:stage VI sporulation protein D [Gracilibacillus halophilus YIM-C55.5]|uniref:Stage VI sporulation protein D n=1 Tax=Gracilibacillus halophilus YIM-C55.5 TaxID=1308866 RepID=N4WP88_9BACI|nr:stage VI sporulation protein D [Gracilibacillus halophilus]ENH97937.1 stage VI sporulation protein D [Gracilibacillus halophilus YIM-C55.5]